MRLSLVIVCFRGDPSALLHELARQRLPGDEVIVVDNAAAEGGTAGVRGHPAVDRLVEPGTNIGFAAGANAGAALAGGDAVVLLNPDVVPLPGCLDALRAPPADWVAWGGLVTLPGGARLNSAGGVTHFLGFAWVERYGEPVEEAPSGPYETGFVSGACLAVRRATWQRLEGLAEPFFMYVEDVDLCHRLRLAGLRYGVVPAARVSHDYAFAKGPVKWRGLERNRWATVVRTFPRPLLAAVLPAMLVLEPLLLAYAVAGGWGRAKLGSWADLVRWAPRLAAERRALQAGATVTSADFARSLSCRFDTPLLGAVAGVPLVHALACAYWAAALRFVRSRP